MKQNKTICLDFEIIEQLKKTPNSSTLINGFLKDYFNKSGNLKESEIVNKINKKEMEIKNLQQDLKSLKENLKKLQDEKKKIKDIYKHIPEEVMEDFKFFDKMNVESLFERHQNIYSRKYKTTWDEIKSAFCEYKGIDND